MHALIILFFAYSKPLNDDLIFENLIRFKNYELCNTRFSIPIRFISPIFSVYEGPHRPISFELNLESFDKDRITIDFYPRFIYDNGIYGVVIEPIFRVGKVIGWPYIKWNNAIAGAFSRAYFFYDKTPFTLFVGRNRFQMNLEGLIAEEDPPMDLIFASYINKHFNFSYFTGELDPLITSESTYVYVPGELKHRYISGHSLELKGRKFSLSFSEIAIHFTQNNLPDPYYLNPFSLYYSRCFESEIYGINNIFWILSGNYWGGKFSSHFEFLVDDFHLPDNTGWVPHKLAWIFKSYIVDFPLIKSISGISYTGATRWTYTHKYRLLYYNNLNEVMGILNENDFDKLEFFVKKHYSRNFDIKTCFSFKRKGEANVDEKDIYGLIGIAYPKDYFLTGIVEKRFGMGLEFDYHTSKIELRSTFEYDWIWNSSHIMGNKGNELRIKLYGRACVF